MRRPQSALAATAIVLGISALGGCVGSPGKGLRAYQRHEYQLALESWTPLAKRGDVDAQFYLGLMYEEGRGVAVDMLAAQDWYLRAASQGKPEAQLNLGRLYAHGKGVEQSFERARMWFEQAAESSLPEAHCNLGIFYLKGYGVDQNLAAAKQLFEAAAGRGDEVAQRILGAMYDEGVGVEASTEDARTWLAAAAAGGDVPSQSRLGMLLLEDGEYEEAARWLAKAAYGGDTRAQYVYGWMLMGGHGVKRDESEALAWIQTAALAGDAESQLTLAIRLIENSRTDDRSAAVEAAEFMRAAAHQGLVEAEFGMGLLYMRGDGVGRSYDEGLAWFRTAARRGFKPAIDKLVMLGETVPRIRADAK